MTYKFGGGCGHDLSTLRPSGDQILGTGGNSCGPTGFMNLFSENTNTIAQHGRRGANMQTLRVDHPDIEKFIEIKTGDIDMIKYSNSRAIRFNKMLVRGFAIKFIFYGVLIITIFTVYPFKPIPFMCSFTSSFIGLHLMEAIVLKKIQGR